MVKAIISFFLVLLFVSTEVSAAEIRKVIPPDSPSLSSIVIEGLIEPGDFLKFKQALTSEPFLDKVTLWSPGGDALEAIKIGRLIRKLRMRTEAPVIFRLKEGNNVFWLNNRVIGSIDHPDFGAFFGGIWLDADSPRPALRAKLVGQK